MPHGSGGGSHSGGSHHSSHHSSHSGGHGGSSRGPRMSRRPFPNARRFRYYDNRGMAHYIYSDTTPRPQSPASVIVSIIFLIPFLVVGIFLFSSIFREFTPPKPLTQNYVFNGVYIEDNAHVLDDNILSDDMTQLNASLSAFKEKTGIAPYIITVYDSDWKGNYKSLESYAYSLYVNRFSDERHFVIVYSEPENAAELEFVDWSWEGMQGDDTDDIITESHFSIFQSDLQRYLTMDDVSVTEAFTRTFSHSLTYMMSSSPDYDLIFGMGFFALLWNAFILFFIILTIRSYINSRRNYEEVPPNDFYNMGNF